MLRPAARLLMATLVGLIGLIGAFSPAASATSGFVEPPKVVVGDSDGDGIAEASASGIAGGPCACRCPVMGADSDVAALGQTFTLGTRSALVVCGTRLAADANPNSPDALGEPRLSGRLRFNPGGIGRGGPAG
jgi:hypothetical protein